MANSFNLPRDPADFRPPSPYGGDGENLFADAESATAPVEASADNPFCPPADIAEPSAIPVRYETTIPHRGGLVLTLGWLGVGAPVLGVVLLGLYALGDSYLAALVCSPLLICCLIFSLPAWIMSSLDMRAINSGAMHPEGRRQTLTGGWLGVLGVFLSLGLGLPAIVIAAYIITLSVLGQL